MLYCIFSGKRYGVGSINTITCKDTLIYSDVLFSFSNQANKNDHPIALLYKKTRTDDDDDEELNEESVASGMNLLMLELLLTTTHFHCVYYWVKRMLRPSSKQWMYIHIGGQVA